MHSHFGEVAVAGSRLEREHFDVCFDELLASINFASKKEAILPENVERTKKAFYTFFKDMEWPLATWNFDDLLEEEIGEHLYRADGITPNWYHQAKQILYRCAKVRSGLVELSQLNLYGGPEVAIATDLRHDSWEDLGKDKTGIYAKMEKRIHDMWGSNGHDDAYYFMLRQKASMIADYVDLMTRKTPRIGEFGEYVRKPNGKLVKDDRFGGVLHLYMDQVLKTPLTIEGKINDGIEGMSTRNISAFDDETNRNYNEERRKIYGRRAIAKEAIIKFPFMESVIKTSDAMLGINLVIMETIVDNSKIGSKPQFEREIDIDRYLPHGIKGFELLGPAWHPITGQLEDLEDKAAAEVKPHTALILQNSLYPALLPHFQKPYNYVDRPANGRAPYLPQGGAYAPNVV